MEYQDKESVGSDAGWLFTCALFNVNVERQGPGMDSPAITVLFR